MQLSLDRSSDIPVGVQLAWALRARIAEMAPGDRLPGVRDIAGAAGVNTNTARSVYARLESEGLIRAEHGRGTFVAEQPAVDERLASVARRALAEAQDAGLDPRELAAALYSGRVADPEPAARRRALRAEIAALEHELAAEVAARSVPDRGVGSTPTGGRILGEDELRRQRDELAGRLHALRAPAAPEETADPTPSTRSVTRPGVRWHPVLGT